MAWLAIRLHADAGVADVFADALMEAGALSVSCDDADAGTSDESAQFAEPGLEAPRAWPRNVLTALVPGDASPQTIVSAAALSCGFAVPVYCVAAVKDADWVRSSQAQFEPIQIADRLWIVPSWCKPPEPSAIRLDQ